MALIVRQQRPVLVRVKRPVVQVNRGVVGPAGPPGAGGAATVFVQPDPASVWGPINHNLGRMAVTATAFNPDYSVQWEDFQVEPIDANNCRLSHDDPVSGVALIV